MNYLLNNKRLLPLVTALCLPRCGVLEAAWISTEKSGEQFLVFSLPPGELAVTFGYVSWRMFCCCHSEAAGPESLLLAAQWCCTAAPSLPNSCFIAPSGKADRCKKPAGIVLENTADDSLIRSHSPSPCTVDLKSSLHTELIFASRQSFYRRGLAIDRKETN